MESLKERFDFTHNITARSIWISLILITFVAVIIAIATYIIVFVREEMSIKDFVEWGVGAISLVGAILFIIPMLRRTNNILSLIEKKL